MTIIAGIQVDQDCTALLLNIQTALRAQGLHILLNTKEDVDRLLEVASQSESEAIKRMRLSFLNKSKWMSR